MRRGLFAVVIGLMVVAGLSLWCWAREVPSSPEVLPLSPGSSWYYEGVARWVEPGDVAPRQQQVSWQMEIREVLARDGVTVAVLKGHPLDLVWYEQGRGRGDYLIVRLAPEQYYLLEGDRVPETLARMRDAADPLRNLVQPEELFLSGPLVPAKRYGGADARSRGDGRYAWLVEGAWPVRFEGRSGPQRLYRVALRTAPEQTLVDFVPGVGMTRFSYTHYGTVAETDLRLVKYTAPTDGGEFFNQ